MSEAFEGLRDFQRIVDDVVVYDETVTEHESHLRAFLQRCVERGISLNAKKFRFAESEARFAGFMLDVLTQSSPLQLPSSRHRKISRISDLSWV